MTERQQAEAAARSAITLVDAHPPGVAPQAADNHLARLAVHRDPRGTAGRGDRTDPSYELMDRERP